MARLVVPKSAAGRLAAKSLNQLSADEYTDRLLKYIPAESVSVYAFIDKALQGYYGLNEKGIPTLRPEDPMMAWLSWAFFIVVLIGTPFYLRQQRLPGQPWGLHAVLATLAFVCWAYTLGGSVFVMNGWYNLLLAAVAAPIFTFAAGIFQPR